MRTITALSRGQASGPESAIDKIIASNQLQQIGNATVEAADQYGSIAGGTDDILKNIIAERVLGLPGDIRIDKDPAFKDLPVGA